MKREATMRLEAAAITDRGLSEKRPVNEDSFLIDMAHRIFAVADGVGGAQSGEVASRIAVETVVEAFRDKRPDEDAEDLMEIAIQRANDRIYRLSAENSKIDMMATTIVALHLDDQRATIGHVGDSRLYRLTPKGELRRETEDHTIVEDEVRAGRMTAEEAAAHPARNVINRALGAETLVEVDTKTIEVEEGTIFLLCSDGITRHISDDELHELLARAGDLQTTCDALKRLCYERGAEDNLTAVIVRFGERRARPGRTIDHSARTEELARPDQRPRISTIAVPLTDDRGETEGARANLQASELRIERKRIGALSKATRSMILLLVLGSMAAAAFYAGMRYDRWANPTPDAAPGDAAAIEYERLTREVDRAPRAALARMTQATDGQPLASNDPEFLCLFGRAALLSGDQAQAMEAFRRAIALLEERRSARDHSLEIEARLLTAAAALRSRDPKAIEEASRTIEQALQRANELDRFEAPTASP
jgi:serine/threonine protein phosphatase PrpC